MKITIQKVNKNKGNTQSMPVILHPAPAYKTDEVYNDISRETHVTVDTAATEDIPDSVVSRQLMEEDVIVDVQNIVELDTSNASTEDFDDGKHAGKNDRSGDLPLMSKTVILSKPSKRNIHTISTAEEKPVNMIMEAAGRLTDAVAQIIKAVDTKSCNSACGLLHFREWWELVGVNIYVGGRQISGVPIFVEEDTLRVIDNDYSYFIPLGKVDFIRTNDGLCSNFNTSDNRPI